MPISFDTLEIAVPRTNDRHERQARPPADAYRTGEAAPSVIGRAVSRFKVWIVLLGVVLAGAGVAYGVVRKPQYSASSSLQVGKVNPNSPGFYGYAQSASDLATSYSRAITATGVLNRVRKTTGLDPVTAAGRLSAEPIPNSDVFRIIAAAPSSAGAVKLANDTASAMVAYEAGNNFNGDAAAALRSYQSQAAAAVNAQAKVRQLQGGGGGTLVRSSPALRSAQVQANTAQMQANALSTAYQQALQAQPASNLVSLLANAVTATSDKTKKIELYGIIGLLAGLVLGTLVAVLSEQHRLRRALQW